MTIRDTVDVSEDQPAEQDILRGILSAVQGRRGQSARRPRE